MTTGRPTRIILLIIFLALLATPLVIKRLEARREVGKAKLDSNIALSRYGFYLQ
jgi:hypothetical protein